MVHWNMRGRILKKDDVMVILLPDHGTRYLAKVYNDQWMKDHGFLETGRLVSAREIISAQKWKEQLASRFRSLHALSEAIRVMNREGIDQIPVTEQDNFVGSVSSSSLLGKNNSGSATSKQAGWRHHG